MAKFGDLDIAAGMREVIERIASSVISKEHPVPRVAKVLSINRENYTIRVALSGDRGSFNVRVNPNLIPRNVGSIVRIAGKPGDYYVSEILNDEAVVEAYETVKTEYDDGNLASTAAVVAAQEDASQAISSYVTEYAVSTSETTAPTTGWSDASPTRDPGEYIWIRTTVVRNDGTSSTTSPALLTGNDGAEGAEGPQGIPGVDGTDGESLYTWIKYADTPTSGMSDFPDGKTYMGISHNNLSPDESTTYTDYKWSLIKGADGSAGADGIGVSSTAVTYAKSTSGTAEPTSGWSTSIPSTVEGEFLWTRTITTYTDSSTSTAYSVAAHGAQGPSGADGSDGVGVSSTAVDYAKNTSGTNPPTSGAFTSSIPATSPGEYLWTRTITTYTDASTSPAVYSVAKHGDTGAQGVPGPKGDDGQPTYTWIRYSANANGSGMTNTPQSDTKYIGIKYNQLSPTEEDTDHTVYTWSLIRGADGSDGSQGPQGPTGDQGVSVTGITLYWAQVADTASAPAQPSTASPGSPWTTEEPAYAPDTKLYVTEKVDYSNGSYSYTNVVLSSSYEAAKQVAEDSMKYVQSRGTNLITNGTGYLGDLTNFSTFEAFVVSDAPTGAVGSFESTVTNRSTDEQVPVDPEQTYKFAFQHRQVFGDGRLYGYLRPNDAFGQYIHPRSVTFAENTLTTLAQPLNPGDTVIELTDGTNWGQNNDAYGGWRCIAFHGYIDPGGKLWPTETYTQDYAVDVWPEGGVVGNTITLNVPWAGDAYPAGHEVSQSSPAGGSFIYPVGNVTPADMEWTYYEGTFGGVKAPYDHWGNNTLPISTATVTVGWLINYQHTISGSTSRIANVKMYSITEALAAQEAADKAAADAAAADAKAVTAQATADGKNAVYHEETRPWPDGDPNHADDLGDVWWDTTDGSNVVHVWDGSAWVQTEPALLGALDTLANETAVQVSNHDEELIQTEAEIEQLRITAQDAKSTAVTADGRVAISDYEPGIDDVEGKVDGSLWITRTRDRQNLCDDPSFETASSYWTVTGATSSRELDELAPAGEYVLEVVNGASGNGSVSYSSGFDVEFADKCAVSAYAKSTGPDITGVVAEVEFFDSGSASLGTVTGDPVDLIDSTEDTLLATDARRITVVTEVPETAVLAVPTFIVPAASVTWRMDAVMFEYSDFVGRYFDGDSEGGVWEGDAHQSHSILDGGAIIRLFTLEDGGWNEKFWTANTISSVDASVIDRGQMNGGFIADATIPIDKHYTEEVVASEALYAGALVNVLNTGGLALARLAKATTGKFEAHGFVLDAVATGEPVRVYTYGYNPYQENLSPGVMYLSDTPGEITSSPPSDKGTSIQRVGYAPNSSTLNFSVAMTVEIV